jgi:arylsulfatase
MKPCLLECPIPGQWPGRQLRPVSGVSFADILRGESPTPHRPIHFLSFRLSRETAGPGEVFYTTEPDLLLPKGKRVAFAFQPTGRWQDIVVEIPTDQRVYKLRIDVSEGSGTATISDLKLTDLQGKVLIAWPEQ